MKTTICRRSEVAIRFGDIMVTRVFPIGLVLVMLITVLSGAFSLPPIGVVNLWERGSVASILMLLGLTFLAPSWVWVTRKYWRCTALWDFVTTYSGLGKVVALLALILGGGIIWTATGQGMMVYQDMRSGPIPGEKGVCTMLYLPSPKVRGSAPKIQIEYADGRLERIQLRPVERKMWREGKGAEIVHLCDSGDPFVLWRWPRTGEVADVRSP